MTRVFSMLSTSMLFHFLFLILTLLTALIPGAVAAEIEQYTLMGVYIEKFTRFVEWPAEAEIEDKSKPFVIGVIGDRTFEAVLNRLFADKPIRDKEVIIRRITDLDNISGCHVLFISKVSKERLREILMTAREYPLLTISDTENFAKSGVLINFFISKKKLRFAINEEAVKESSLTFSYRLMQVAEIVNPSESRQR